jgi:NADP-dependent 3-hydroxy acid dehydrogenase YdfG
VIAHGSIADSPIEWLDAQFQSNVRLPYRVTQRLLPMLRKRPGQIVFINSSIVLGAARSNVSQFAATQHAVRAVADTLRQEVNGDGIRVLCVYPGRTATSRQEHLYSKEGKTYRPELLLQPEDIATMVVAALSLPTTAEVTDINIRPMLKSY